MGGWVQYRVILTGGVNMSGWGGCIEHHTGWIYLLKTSGTWCSGITPAQHAGGPGFNPQRVHCLSCTHGASRPWRCNQELHRYPAQIICRCENQQRHITFISIDHTAFLRTSEQTMHMLISITRVFIPIQLLHGKITTHVWWTRWIRWTVRVYLLLVPCSCAYGA